VFGTVIKWDEKQANSLFHIQFIRPGPSSPMLFTDWRTFFQGGKVTSISESPYDEVARSPKPLQCNKYSVVHQTQGVPAASADPKIIVSGGGGGGAGRPHPPKRPAN
jgi:hypothetical protein